MFMTSIKLYRCNRFEQLLIDTLEIDFTKVMQVIIGSNGAGKSSLVSQFSPLPPDVADFNKGGYKEWRGHHKGATYVAISDYGDRNGHYFEKDGEILNNWGTATIQRALVEQEFGLTPLLFQMLSGTLKFTTMNPTQRRDCVMLLSKMNIDWLMDIFNEAKIQHRDTKGYLNTLTSRLELEARGLVSVEEIADKTLQVEALKKEYDHYAKFARINAGVTKENTTLKQRYKALVDEMDVLLSKTPYVRDFAPELKLGSLDDVVEHLARLKYEVSAHSSKVDFISVRLQEAAKNAEARELVQNEGVKTITDAIASLRKQVDTLEHSVIGYDYSVTDAGSAKTDYDQIYLTVRDLLSSLPDNTGLKFSTPNLAKLKEVKEVFLSNLDKLRANQHRLEHNIEHIQTIGDVQCPDCNVTFKPGVKDKDLSTYQFRLETAVAAIQSNLEGLELVKVEIQECEDYLHSVKDIYRYMDAHTYNRPLWNEIKKAEFYKGSTDDVVDMMDKHIDLLATLIQVEALNESIMDQEHTLEIVKQKIDALGEEDLTTMSELDISYDEAITQVETAKDTYNRLLRFKVVYDQYLLDVAELDSKVASTNKELTAELDRRRGEFIDSVKFDVLTEMNALTAIIDSAKTKQAIYDDVVSEANIATRNLDEYTTILKNLSPNTGIIADIMHESITGFVGFINNTIRSIWTTDLTVLPCVNAKDVMDWKFPVMVENGVKRADVLRTSTSQASIINTALQFITAAYLGEGDYPMFFDEFGSSMDEQHQLNAMDIVADLADTASTSQVFMISHFAAFHSRFTNAETLVLDPTNIINLPKVHNQHVVMA